MKWARPERVIVQGGAARRVVCVVAVVTSVAGYAPLLPS